jgi:hypothetical protein
LGKDTSDDDAKIGEIDVCPAGGESRWSHGEDLPKVGDWHWVKFDESREEEEESEAWLGGVVHVGFNYVELVECVNRISMRKNHRKQESLPIHFSSVPYLDHQDLHELIVDLGYQPVISDSILPQIP